MSCAVDQDELRRHQQAALDVLARGLVRLEERPDALLADHGRLRAELDEVLFGYQRYKHERIFNPALASDDPQRIAWARHMKTICISAGEVFRTHRTRWSADAIIEDWERYKAASRLTVNQLRRHIVAESDGIAELLASYD